MDPHPLDRPVWHALTGRQAAFALGEGPVRRFAPQYGPLTGTLDASPASLEALTRLPIDEAGLWLLSTDSVAPPPGLTVSVEAVCAQMVAERMTGGGADIAFQPLGEADAAEMLALATLTRPGPFSTETWRLGSFIGVRRDGALIAMAGERMRPVGYTEVSGVCTHPDHRGRGLAAGLMRVVMGRILARGETPFLHSYASNTAAIGLYETLGFRRRRDLTATVLTRAA